jgi:hypothetical protein
MRFNISVDIQGSVFCFTLISFNGVTISRTPVNNFLKQFQFSFTGFVSLQFVQSILFNSSTKLAVLYFFKDLILMFFKYRKSNNSEDHKKFCIIRNKVQREVKSTRSNYFSDKIEENKNDQKKLWKLLYPRSFIWGTKVKLKKQVLF